jgi:hypothetical protein
VLLGLALAETMVVHIVAMAAWGLPIAIALGMVDLSGLLAIVLLLRSTRRHPVALSADLLVMRLGTLRTLAIPISQVAGLRAVGTRAELKQKSVLNLALANWPNVVVVLEPPIAYRRRQISAVAHKLDHPKAFAAALARIMEAR